MNRRTFSNPASIARQWAEGGASIDNLMVKYHAGYGVIRRIISKYLSPQEIHQIKKTHEGRGGVETRFYPGQPAWNKGIHFDSGGRSHETRFKPGQMRGAAARKYRPVGSITIRKMKSGHRGIGRCRKRPYHWIKVKDIGPPQYCWIQLSRFNYERFVGPIPDGFFPIHKDGDTLNDDLSNLVLVDRSGNLRRNSHNPNARILAISSRIETCRQKRERKILDKEIHPELQLRVRINCPECGWGCNSNKPPDRCPKCGNTSFELLE